MLSKKPVPLWQDSMQGMTRKVIRNEARAMKFYISRAQLPLMVELPSKRFDMEAWRRLPELRRANGGVMESPQSGCQLKGTQEGDPSDHEH